MPREAFRVLRPGGRLATSDIVIDDGLDRLPLDEAHIRAALSWAGCVAGALTMDQYRQLLAEAGFEEIIIEVQQRYTPDDLRADAPATLAALPAESIDALVSCSSSSAVTARKPVSYHRPNVRGGGGLARLRPSKIFGGRRRAVARMLAMLGDLRGRSGLLVRGKT